MLSSADAELAGRDLAIPGLAVLLDPNALLAFLQIIFPNADLKKVVINDLKYRPGLKCTVDCKLHGDGTTVEFYAKARRSDSPVSLENMRINSDPPGPLGPGRIILQDRTLTFSFFPNDRKLAGLNRLARTESRGSLLRELIPDRPDLWQGTLRSIGWKPERRYVAQLLTDEGVQAALKFWTTSGYAANRENVRSFASRGPLRIAQVIAESDQHSMLVFEWLSGPVLRNVFADPGFDLGLVENVGGALSALHSQSSQRLASQTLQDQIERLQLDSNWIGLICPSLATLADDLVQRFSRHLADSPRLAAAVHGDFTPRQILVCDSSTVGVIDFDDAIRGDPAADLGKFTAYLERDAINGHLPASRVEPLKEAFLYGYGKETKRPIPERVELYAAMGLLRLATHPFRRRESSWLERVETMLLRATMILERFERGRGAAA